MRFFFFSSTHFKRGDERIHVARRVFIDVFIFPSLHLIFAVHLVERGIEGSRRTYLVEEFSLASISHLIGQLNQLLQLSTYFNPFTILQTLKNWYILKVLSINADQTKSQNFEHLECLSKFAYLT